MQSGRLRDDRQSLSDVLVARNSTRNHLNIYRFKSKGLMSFYIQQHYKKAAKTATFIKSI